MVTLRGVWSHAEARASWIMSSEEKKEENADSLRMVHGTLRPMGYWDYTRTQSHVTWIRLKEGRFLRIRSSKSGVQVEVGSNYFIMTTPQYGVWSVPSCPSEILKTLKSFYGPSPPILMYDQEYFRTINITLSMECGVSAAVRDRVRESGASWAGGEARYYCAASLCSTAYKSQTELVYIPIHKQPPKTAYSGRKWLSPSLHLHHASPRTGLL